MDPDLIAFAKQGAPRAPARERASDIDTTTVVIVGVLAVAVIVSVLAIMLLG